MNIKPILTSDDEKPKAAKGSLAMQALRFIWNRRQKAANLVYITGQGLGWLYDKFPLPRHVKDIATELTFHSIEHFVVQSKGYQNWLHRREGLTRLHGLFQSEEDLYEKAPQPIAPTQSEWASLIKDYQPPQRKDSKSPPIAIIIPVYKGFDETLTCIYSVLKAKVQTPYTLTVINDASPDRALTDAIRKLNDKGLFELMVHPQNLGFVRTVNEGMRHHATQDVVLLNADTEVYDGWLDRMVETLQMAKHTATVTPFSNHAELCSYPKTFSSNNMKLELSYRALDQLASYSNHDYTPTLPTAVGFCMMIRRRALDEVGYFDEETFGRGYGEENDWCLRATDKGWQHVLAGNVFVRHTGAVSFAGHKSRQLKRALRIINKRHPHYRELVRTFKDEDPLLPYRQQLDLARLQYLGSGNSMLFISHNAGGGTERHVHDMTKLLAREGITAYRLSPDPKHASKLRLWHEDAPYCPNLTFDIDHEREELIECLKALGIHHIHLHHLIGFPQRMIAFLPLLCREMECQFDVTVHDYFFICPSINLVYDSNKFEGNPSIETSEHWARHHPTPAGRTPIWLWRELHESLLRQARCVFVPSDDSGKRLQHYFSHLNVCIRPHPETVTETANLFVAHKPSEPLQVAVIGRMSEHKGSSVLLAMAQNAKERKLPIQFHVFGEADQAGALRKTDHVTIHGAYAEEEIYSLLAKSRCHIALVPSVWPETYCYTLSIAYNAKIYPVSFNLGAPAERIRHADWGHILPLQYLTQPAVANDRLLALHTNEPDSQKLATAFMHYNSITQDYYGLPMDIRQSEQA